MNGLLQDLRHGLRGLLRQPGYSALAVATLALGIGATTVMFTLVQGVLLSPLPGDDPDALMMVWETTPRADRQVASAPNFRPDALGRRRAAPPDGPPGVGEHPSHRGAASGTGPRLPS
jgi:hypothetical protein